MTEQEAKDKIEQMLEEARRIVEEAREEAHELKRRAREERRRERWVSGQRKKEKMLNLRIGAELEEKLKDEAQRLSIPVSSLVRNLLDNALDIVGGITKNVGELVEDVVEDAADVKDSFKTAVKTTFTSEEDKPKAETPSTEKAKKGGIEDVPVWREVTLGKPAGCASCLASIPRWFRAHTGRCEKTDSTVFVCDPCMEKLKQKTGNS